MGALLKIFINGENAFLFLLSFFGLHFRPASNGAAKRNNNLQPLLHPRFRPTISISSCLHGKLVLAKRNTVIHPPAIVFVSSFRSVLFARTNSIPHIGTHLFIEIFHECYIVLPFAKRNVRLIVRIATIIQIRVDRR